MDSSALTKNLIYYIYTKEEADEVVERLTAHLNSKFSFADTSDSFTNLRPEVTKLLNDTITKDMSIEQTKLLVEELKQSLKLPVIHITLSYIPQEKGIEKITAKVRQLYGVCLLEFSYDNTLIGGAVIISGGRYHDYSIKRKLQTVFEKYPEEINKLLV